MPLAYHTNCSNLQTLEENWQTGDYKVSKQEFPLEGDLVDDFLMTETRIVRPNESKKCFELYNRWTIEFQKVFYFTILYLFIDLRVEIDINPQFCFLFLENSISIYFG